MNTVFLYNISGAKAAGIKMLCRKMLFNCREVYPSEFGVPLGELPEEAKDLTEASGFTEAMLYLDIPHALVGLFLDQLKRKKLTVSLKAVRTETNIGFTSEELYRELRSEREALSKR